MQEIQNNLGTVAMGKARELQSLIDIIKNTDLNVLMESIETNRVEYVSLINNLDKKMKTLKLHLRDIEDTCEYLQDENKIMKNLKLIPLWGWAILLGGGIALGLWLGGNEKCSGCDCDAGCCDSGVCVVEDCGCGCKK